MRLLRIELNARPDIVKKRRCRWYQTRQSWVQLAELRDAELIKPEMMRSQKVKPIVFDGGNKNLTEETEKKKKSVFKNYKSGFISEMTARTQKLMTNYTRLHVYVIAKFSTDRIVDSLYANRKDDIKTVNAVIHHQVLHKREVEREHPTTIVEQLCFKRQYEFNFIEMDMWDVPNED